jgi:hypothetical protein
MDTEAAYVSGGLILIPGLWLTAYYNKFPGWLRILSVLASIPRIIMIANYYAHIPLQRNGVLEDLVIFSRLLLPSFGDFMLGMRKERNIEGPGLW